jgi:hypothetical protein
MFPFDGYLGDVRRDFLQRLFGALFSILWIPIFGMLCKRAVLLILWRASLFLGPVEGFFLRVIFPLNICLICGGFECFCS